MSTARWSIRLGPHRNALVGVHPFGGFNMSGTDSKAGGRDYLLLFLQAKVSAERVGATTRRVAEATATD